MEKHGSVYRDIVARCQTVVSAPLVVSLTGARRLSSRDVILALQLPRRAWVGIERGGGHWRLGELVELDAATSTFIDAPAQLRQRCEELVQGLGSSGACGTVHVLIEGQNGRSLSTVGAVSSALTVALEVDDRQLECSDVQALRDPSTCREAEVWVRRLFPLILQREKVLRSGKVTGCSVVAGFSPTPCRLVAVEGNAFSSAEAVHGGSTRSLSPAEWATDVAVLSCRHRDSLGQKHEHVFDDAKLNRFLRTLGKNVSPLTGISHSLEGYGDDAAEQLHDRAFVAVLEAWSCLLATPGSEAAQEQLMESIRKRLMLLLSTSRSIHTSVRDVLALLQRALHTTPYCAFPMGTGQHGGSTLILAPASVARSQLESLTLQSGSDTDTNPLILEYASWRDGMGAAPLRVEQHLAGGLVSELIESDALSVTSMGTTGPVTSVYPRRSVSALRADLVIDAISERLTIGGKSVASTEIASQRMVVRMMQLLLKSQNQVIPSTALPHSTYRSSRGELMSKVVSPLIRTIAARTGKQLNLRAKGATHDYQMSLDASEASILLLEPFVNEVV